MPECPKCHSKVNFGEKTCPACGQDLLESAADTLREKAAAFTDTPDTTGEYDAADMQSNRLMALLSYFGILVLIPIFAAQHSRFVRFHANQGLVLLIAGVVLQAAAEVVKRIPLIGFAGSILRALVTLIWAVLMILGIIHVINGEARELPLIGKFRILK